MSKLPAKQIYLLMIIIVGIITLSIYSTYAIFTYEEETSDIVNIHTPNSLTISTDVYEYKQLTIPKNSMVTTDIDIYNPFDYELCYSIWYKEVKQKDDDENYIKIYQKTKENLTASGIISAMDSKRVTLLIINDNDEETKVNIGLANAKNEGTCSLNISNDKDTVTSTIDEFENLSEYLIANIKTENIKEGYLTYKDKVDIINLKELEKIYISDKFSYEKETFTLINPEEITLIETKDLKKYLSSDDKKYYTCLSKESCRIMYQINETTEETITEEQTDGTKIDKYYHQITKYYELHGYLSGETGLKKVSENNKDAYIYYGDNPNNFIYYNCQNEQDPKSCELWRIIGFFYDETENKYLTKIIKDDTIGTYTYTNTSENKWETSTLNEYLNEEYKLNNSGYLKKIKQSEENLTDLNLTIDKIIKTPVNKENKVTIMSLNDYLKASNCKDKKINEYDKTCLDNNWLNKNYSVGEWTLTTKYLEKTIETPIIVEPEENTDESTTEDTTNETVITQTIIEKDSVYSVNSDIKETNINEKLNVRPVVYLKSRILLSSGDGTIDNPYIIK